MSLTHPLTTTTFDLPGYRVAKSFGVVRGIIVRSRSVIGVRYDATEIAAGITEVLCYGTAVYVEAG